MAWTDYVAGLPAHVTVTDVEDRAGFMERWNTIPPQSSFPVPDHVYVSTSPRAVRGTAALNFVHSSCIVWSGLADPGELAFLLGRPAPISTTPAPSLSGVEV